MPANVDVSSEAFEQIQQQQQAQHLEEQQHHYQEQLKQQQQHHQEEHQDEHNLLGQVNFVQPNCVVMETDGQQLLTPQQMKPEPKEISEQIVPEIPQINGKIHTFEPLKENSMNHQNISVLSNNSSPEDVERLMKNVSILKSLNNQILNMAVDRMILAEDNVSRLIKENDNLRQLLQEMHDHEPKMKEELLNAVKTKEANFAKILEQKEQDYEQLRQAYEEISERGGNNQEVSKLQTKLKFMETKLKSVQTQLDNKTKENEELSNMMNELCGQQV